MIGCHGRHCCNIVDGQWCIHRGEIVNLLTLLQIIAVSNTVWISQIQNSWVHEKQNWTISCLCQVVFQEEIPMWAVFAKSFSPESMWSLFCNFRHYANFITLCTLAYVQACECPISFKNRAVNNTGNYVMWWNSINVEELQA